MKAPWPRYPCHPCTDDAVHQGRVPPLGKDGFPRWGEATTYAWHSAMWDRISGRWDAVCCLGHRKKGWAPS